MLVENTALAPTELVNHNPLIDYANKIYLQAKNSHDHIQKVAPNYLHRMGLSFPSVMYNGHDEFLYVPVVYNQAGSGLVGYMSIGTNYGVTGLQLYCQRHESMIERLSTLEALSETAHTQDENIITPEILAAISAGINPSHEESHQKVIMPQIFINIQQPVFVLKNSLDRVLASIQQYTQAKRMDLLLAHYVEPKQLMEHLTTLSH